MGSCIFGATLFWGYGSYSKTHMVAAVMKHPVFLGRDMVVCIPSKKGKLNM